MLARWFTVSCLLIAGCSIPQIVVLHDPLTAEEHLLLGLSYEKKGVIDEAIKHYENASKSDARGFLFLGNLYLNQKNYDMAEQLYRKAIKKNDKLADAYNNLAWIYVLENKNLDEAENMVKKAIEIEQNNPEKLKLYEDTFDKIHKLKLKIK